MTSAPVAHTTARAIALFVLLSPLWLAERASADHRDFAGRVVAIAAQSLVVKDRRGNSATFARSEKTQVEGRSGWDAIAVGDQVLVRWHLGDGVAHHVIVLERPPRATTR